MHPWCYGLHGILFALHVILILLLIHHPEHCVTMSVYSTWVTTLLSICLQAFYVVSLFSYLFFHTLPIQSTFKLYTAVWKMRPEPGLNRRPPRCIPGALPTELYGQGTNANARGVCLALWGYTLMEMPARRSYSKCTECTFPTRSHNLCIFVHRHLNRHP